MRKSKHFLNSLIGVCFLMATTLGVGQTVLNGGFEQVTGYPSQPGAIELATHWLNIGTVTSAPDLFHVLGSDAGDLPETPIAIVSPYQGMAIAGFSPYDMMNEGRRQYISGSFSEALIVGQRYLMTFQMTNGEITEFSNAGLGLSGMGMRFSEGPLQQLGEACIDLPPQFVFSQVFYNREWQQISFNFIAQEPWTNFAWGLFGNEAGNVTAEQGASPSKVYCFVDGISLSPAAAIGSDEALPDRGPNAKPGVSLADLEAAPSWFVPSAFTPNGDGDNDVFLPVCENVSIRSFQVYSRWGEMIFSGFNNDVSWDGNNQQGKSVESGSYVWKLELVDPTGKVFSKSGSLSLIR